MPNNQEIAAKAFAKAREHWGKSQYKQVVTACGRAIKADQQLHSAYKLRWMALGQLLAPEKIAPTLNPEVEDFLAAQPESPEVLFEAYWGYMQHPERTKNVPDSLFGKMLKCAGTDTRLTALLGMAERSEEAREQWAYYRCIIDEFTASGTSHLSWYLMAHQRMLKLAEQDRTLAKTTYFDELIERCLETHLSHCKKYEQPSVWAYREAANFRLSFGAKLGKALEVLDKAQASIAEKKQLELYKEGGGSVEQALQDLMGLRGKIYVAMGEWKKALQALRTTVLKEYPGLYARFSEITIEHFYLMGRAEEGLNKLDSAARRYTDAYFAPQPHADALGGLKRIYKIQHGLLKGFKAYIKTEEIEYRKRETEELKKIGHRFVQDKMEQSVPNFQLESVDGLPFRLADMRGSVVLFDIWASWCHWCHRATPQLEKVYEHFIAADDVALLGINDGESLEKVEAFLQDNQPPWFIFLDPERKVRKVCGIRGIPAFILFDKEGKWQYKLSGYHDWLGQELIWLIDELRKAE